MSTTTVRSQIKTAMKTTHGCSNGHVSAAETDSILAEARKGGVTAGEGKLVADLYAKGHLLTPGSVATRACPEHPASWYSYDAGAKAKMNTFFTEQNLPYGDNAAKIKAKVEAKLADVDLGTRLPHAPSTANLHELLIADQRPVDGARRDAFIDAKKNSFYLKVTGSGFGGPQTVGPFWYGPFSLESAPAQTGVTSQRRSQILSAFNKASRQGLTWTSSMPLGVRYARVPLLRERHPDGYAYTALIAVGALAPGAPTKDPNTVPRFFVERTGGFAGMTSFAGPIDI